MQNYEPEQKTIRTRHPAALSAINRNSVFRYPHVHNYITTFENLWKQNGIPLIRSGSRFVWLSDVINAKTRVLPTWSVSFFLSDLRLGGRRLEIQIKRFGRKRSRLKWERLGSKLRRCLQFGKAETQAKTCNVLTSFVEKSVGVGHVFGCNPTKSIYVCHISFGTSK